VILSESHRHYCKLLRAGSRSNGRKRKARHHKSPAGPLTLLPFFSTPDLFLRAPNTPLDSRSHSLFARLISHQPAVFFSQNESATGNQPQPAISTLLSEQTSTSHQSPANRTGRQFQINRNHSGIPEIIHYLRWHFEHTSSALPPLAALHCTRRPGITIPHHLLGHHPSINAGLCSPLTPLPLAKARRRHFTPLP
jgi:hypothetical protein